MKKNLLFYKFEFTLPKLYIRYLFQHTFQKDRTPNNKNVTEGETYKFSIRFYLLGRSKHGLVKTLKD